MPSRKPTQLARSALYVESSVEQNDETVDQALADRYNSLLRDGETIPDFKLTMRLIQRDLAGSRQAVVASDVTNLEELADDDKIRRRKNELSETIGNRITRWRGLFDRAFGPGRGLELAGIEADLATDLVGILRQGQRVVSRCRQQVETGFGTPDLKGVELIPQEIVDDLQPDCDELATLTVTLNREERERQTTQIAKDETLDSHVETFTPSAQVLQGFYLLAGFAKLAAQVKPSTRRPGRREVETQQADDDDGNSAPGVRPTGVRPPGSQPAGSQPSGVQPAGDDQTPTEVAPSAESGTVNPESTDG